MRRHAKASFAGSTLGSGIRRTRFGLISLCLLGLAAFLGSSAPSAGAQACPNETFRNGPSGKLPNCRAYEKVTPDMEGLEINDKASPVAPAPVTSPDGNAVAWGALAAFGEGAVSNGLSSVYTSQRGASWSSQEISPPVAPYALIIVAPLMGFTENLDQAVFEGANEPPLTPDAAPGSPNLYLRDNGSGSYRLLSVGVAPGEIGAEKFHARGLSSDAGHVVFEAKLAMPGCEAGSSPYLCDWSAATGAVSPVAGPGAAGAVDLAGPNSRRPVSADGSRIFFEGGGGGCGLCVRINGATTQTISATGDFEFASSDGSVAYITDGEELKPYNVAADELGPSIAGEVQGVLGTSTDGSRVYLVSKEELAPGASPGENNLFLWTAGAGFQFITTGNTSSTFTDNYEILKPASRVTPDGMHLAFQANNSLTGFPDNGQSEAYLYSAATGELVCATCVVAEPASGAFINGGTGFRINRLSRNLSDDGGHLFFLTEEALVPLDSNGLQDTYQYDAASGEVALISPGTGDCGCTVPAGIAGNAYFGDASADGNDALFWTREQLVPADQDEALDVYDARVNGGLASQHPAPPPPPCTGDECRGASSSPGLAGPASAGFVGKGNVSQRQNCNKLGREAKKLSNRAKRLRKNAKTAKRNGKSGVAKKRNKKATRLAKRARSKSKSAKRCRKANRRASK